MLVRKVRRGLVGRCDILGLTVVGPERPPSASHCSREFYTAGFLFGRGRRPFVSCDTVDLGPAGVKCGSSVVNDHYTGVRSLGGEGTETSYPRHYRG